MNDALHVQRTLGAHRGEMLRVAAAVDRGIDVHVAGEVFVQLGAVAGEEVDHAAGEVAGGEHLAEGDRAQRHAR